MKASVVVVTHAGASHLDDGLASLTPYAERSDVEVILVDNGSADGSGDTAEQICRALESYFECGVIET